MKLEKLDWFRMITAETNTCQWQISYCVQRNKINSTFIRTIIANPCELYKTCSLQIHSSYIIGICTHMPLVSYRNWQEQINGN